MSGEPRLRASALLPFEAGQRVTVDAIIVESFPGDTCVHIQVGDRRFRQSFWVPTDAVKGAEPEPVRRMVPRR